MTPITINHHLLFSWALIPKSYRAMAITHCIGIFEPHQLPYGVQGNCLEKVWRLCKNMNADNRYICITAMVIYASTSFFNPSYIHFQTDDCVPYMLRS